MLDIKEIINLEQYPINDTGSLKYKKLINYTRKQLNEDGCCVLSNFIRPNSIRRMKDEVDRNLGKIYFIIFAIHDDLILYTTFNKDIGLQFFKNSQGFCHGDFGRRPSQC